MTREGESKRSIIFIYLVCLIDFRRVNALHDKSSSCTFFIEVVELQGMKHAFSKAQS